MKINVCKTIAIQMEISIQEAEILIAAFEDARKLRRVQASECSLSDRQIEEIRAIQANLCDMTEEAHHL